MGRPWLTAAVNRLARYCQADRPVVVMIGPVRWWADTSTAGRVYLIRLDPGMDARAMVETLAHEWAHAMTWRLTRVDHGERWGRAHSRCYRVTLERWAPRYRWSPA